LETAIPGGVYGSLPIRSFRDGGVESLHPIRCIPSGRAARPGPFGRPSGRKNQGTARWGRRGKQLPSTAGSERVFLHFSTVEDVPLGELSGREFVRWSEGGCCVRETDWNLPEFACPICPDFGRGPRLRLGNGCGHVADRLDIEENVAVQRKVRDLLRKKTLVDLTGLSGGTEDVGRGSSPFKGLWTPVGSGMRRRPSKGGR